MTDMIEIEAIGKAVQLGHDVEVDPPAACTAARRWTCKRCGDAVLAYGTNIYGSASKEPCHTTGAATPTPDTEEDNNRG